MQNKFFYSISSLCVALFVPFGGAWAQSNSSASSCEYLIRAGDSLSVIAQRELGATHRWQEIRNMNPDKIGEDDLIIVGEYLMLPCDFVLVDPDNGTSSSSDNGATSVESETAELISVATDDGASSSLTLQVVYPDDVVWQAAAGSRLSRVLTRWANEAGYHLVVRSKNDWVFDVPFAYKGDLRSALEMVVTGFSLTHVTPSIAIYTNKVIVLD